MYWYPVHWGETLSSIAWRTGVSAWAIAQTNGLYNPNYIYAGQSLWIPCPY
jgi:LysM repeat protein